MAASGRKRRCGRFQKLAVRRRAARSPRRGLVDGRASTSEHSPMTPFTDAELLDRACLRVAGLIRGMWEEKGSSDTRLLEEPLLPDRLTVVGRSRALRPGDKARREHVVPRLVILKACHAMLPAAADVEIAAFIRDHVRIVMITEDEQHRLDHRDALGLRQTMPKEWVPGGDLYARLRAADIAWEPIAPVQAFQAATEEEGTSIPLTTGQESSQAEVLGRPPNL
jgi:hypothetical protein